MKAFFKGLTPFFWSGGICIALAFLYSRTGDVLPHLTDEEKINSAAGLMLFLTAMLIAAFQMGHMAEIQTGDFKRRTGWKELVALLGGYPATMIGAAVAGPFFIGLAYAAGLTAILVECLKMIFLAG